MLHTVIKRMPLILILALLLTLIPAVYAFAAVAAPSNLTATVNADKDVTLTWTDNSNNETFFEIYRKTETGAVWEEIGSVSANVTAYTDTTPVFGTYYYRVVALKVTFSGSPIPMPVFDYSPDSNIAKAFIPLPIIPLIPGLPLTPVVSPPAAPTNLNLPANYEAQPDKVSLVWTDKATDEDGFVIERKPIPAGPLFPITFWQKAGETAANVKTFTDSGLSPASSYQYRVRAFKGSAEDGVYSEYSNTLTVTTAEAVLPPALPEPPAPPTDPAYIFPFTDVADSAWYRNDVEIAHKNKLIDGKTAATYAPDDNMTVAEAIKLAACMNQLYNEGAVTLANGSVKWYSTYVDYAKAHSIIAGDYADYNVRIDRLEFVNVFYNALPASEYAPKNTVADNAIPDMPLSAPNAAKVYAFYRAGVLTGNDAAGSFNPSSHIKRSEVAAILTRMFDAAARKSITLD